MEQIDDIMKQERFDYIVIEASGVCEPAPIAQTICSISSMGKMCIRDRHIAVNFRGFYAVKS